MKSKLTLILLPALLAVPTLSNAAIVQYSNQTTFINSTMSESIGELPVSGSSGTTVGAVTFTNGPSASIAFTEWSTVIAGSELAASGSENYNFSINGGAYSFGFDAYEPTSSSTINGCNFICVDSTFELTIFNDTNDIGTITFNLDDNILNFVGITSDALFNRVEIREIIGTADNEFIGNILVGTQNVSAVPVPPSIWLFISGFLALFLKRKKYSI